MFSTRIVSDQPSFRRPYFPDATPYQRDISGSANNGNVGGHATAGAGSINVGNGIGNCEYFGHFSFDFFSKQKDRRAPSCENCFPFAIIYTMNVNKIR